MKFLIDAHFPIRLKRWLIDDGHDAIHAEDLPQGSKTPDLAIIERAGLEDRIIITKDSDFIRYRILSGKPDRLLMVTTGNIINRELLKLFERNFFRLKELFEAGYKVIELDNATITVIE